jgi:dTDP-4-dehydrorhamnose reductase
MVTALYHGGHRGTFHAVNAGYASRVEIAQEIARQLHVSAPEIIPVTTASISLPARRPLNSRLSIDKISKLGIHPPTWQDAIERYLKTL